MDRCETCDRPKGWTRHMDEGHRRSPEQCHGGPDNDPHCKRLRVDWRNRYLVERWRRERAERQVEVALVSLARSGSPRIS